MTHTQLLMGLLMGKLFLNYFLKNLQKNLQIKKIIYISRFMEKNQDISNFQKF
jgi:hypothetical protein